MSAFVHEFGQDSATPFILWGKALLDDPRAALSDILSGRGARGAQQRAEPEDFLADLMAHPAWQEQRTHLLEGLDAALLNWLETYIEWPPARINRFGTRAYAARIADALKVAARLPMKITARHLMRDQSTWDNRFRGLRWPGDIDLLRQFNLVLAQHQLDTRFASRWFAACDEATWGSPYWQTSLGTGLTGLRKLPDTADTAPERRVAAALARFAALALQRGMRSHVVQTTFRRRVAALTVLYPRHDGYWREVWDHALDDRPSSLAKELTTIRTDWLANLPFNDGADGESPQRQGYLDTRGPVAIGRNHLPDQRRLRNIERAIRRARSLDDSLWERTRDLIRAHWRYASSCGDGYFAVRTTHNLCDLLLPLKPSQQYLVEIHRWVLQAIMVEADNAHIWDLWSKILSALGQHEESLSIQWESTRRFPDNCVLRTSLSETLLRHRRGAIAENLLRVTMQDFPRDVFSRHILVKMLLRQGRQEEAESEFATLKALDSSNPYVRSLEQLMSTAKSKKVRVVKFRSSEDRSVEIDVHTRGRSGLEQADERANGVGSIGAESEISTYLKRLAQQTPVLERYFAFPGREGGNGWTSETLPPYEIESELGLVAAHRTGLMEGPGRRDHLKNWVRVRPSSYSARLLLSWWGKEGNGMDRAAMLKIAKEFPEHRRWNNWLCYGFIDEDKRSSIRREECDRTRQQANGREDEVSAIFWGGRLSAVYPELRMEKEDIEDGASYDPAALKRLVEDVAFAGADRALPSLWIS